MICSLCSELPDDLTVNTGREEDFPAAFYQLTSLDGYSAPSLRRCPECGMFFEWIDLPQMYGSGNCAEERSIRLSGNASRLLDHLFPANQQNPGNLGEAAEYFETLPLNLLLEALANHARNAPEIVAPFVPHLVQLLGTANNSLIWGVLSAVSTNPEGAQAILEASHALNENAQNSYHLTELLASCRKNICADSHEGSMETHVPPPTITGDTATSDTVTSDTVTSVMIDYREGGAIAPNTPLEPFYDALLPLLKVYGLAAAFPAESPSTDYTFWGDKFDVLIGEPPGIFSYYKTKDNPYGNNPRDRGLMIDGLSHLETGEPITIVISISDSWLNMVFEGEESQVKAMRNTLNPILTQYGFKSETLETKPVAGEPIKP